MIHHKEWNIFLLQVFTERSNIAGKAEIIMRNKLSTMWLRQVVLQTLFVRLAPFAVSFLFLSFLIVGSTAYPQSPLPAKIVKPKQGLIRLSTQVAYGSNLDHFYGKAALVFDDQYAYLAGPGGLYRTALPLTSQSTFDLVGFQNKNIFNLYVNNGSLYVLKESIATQGGPATDHSFLRSDDHGATFVPLDSQLQECIQDSCEFLAPTQAIFKNGLIFVNAGAGGNLFVTANNGASWTALMGSFHRMLADWQALELINNRMLVGGASFEEGYLQGGALRPDFLGWKQLPSDVVAPNLANRGARIIKNKPNTSDVYAGVAGGLLKSTDGGQNFQYVIAYPITSPVFPYANDILFPSRAANVVVLAGRDSGKPFLAYSKDNGETWMDISAKVQSTVADPGSGSSTSSIDFLVEDANGNIFAGVVYGPTHTLKILQLQFNSAMFR
jgi:hypothetical protein